MKRCVFIPFSRDAEASPLRHADQIDEHLKHVVARPIEGDSLGAQAASYGKNEVKRVVFFGQRNWSIALKLVTDSVYISAHCKPGFEFLTSTDSSSTCSYIDPYRLARMVGPNLTRAKRVYVVACGSYTFAQEFERALQQYRYIERTVEVYGVEKETISEADEMLGSHFKRVA